MSTDMFNAWEVLAASTVATIITGGIAVAWAQGRLAVAQQYWAAGEAEFDKAERLAAEHDRTRNLPWYWPTDGSMAIEAAPAEPEPAADLHVTGELLAIDGVDTETDAPHEDTDRAGMWRVLLGLASDLVDRVHDWLPNLLARWRKAPVNPPYRGRHWVSDVQHTGAWPLVVPQQRSGDADE